MFKSIINSVTSIKAFGVMALVALLVPASSNAQTSYDFSSSSAETGALSGALAGQALTIILQAFAVLAGVAITLMGIAWVWRKFKQFTGMGKKI